MIKRLLISLAAFAALVFIPHYLGGFCARLFSDDSQPFYGKWLIGFVSFSSLLGICVLIWAASIGIKNLIHWIKNGNNHEQAQ
jgi:hypothetical protein